MASVEAYLAGLIDADGSIGIKKVEQRQWQPGYMPRVTIRQVAFEAIDFLQQHYPAYRGTQRGYTPNARPQQSWQATNQKAAHFVQAILPFLLIKSRQAEIVIEVAAINSEPKCFEFDPYIEGESVVTTAEAAEFLDTTIESVGQACRKGSAPCTKKDGRYLIASRYLPEWKQRPNVPPRQQSKTRRLEELWLECRELNKVGQIPFVAGGH